VLTVNLNLLVLSKKVVLNLNLNLILQVERKMIYISKGMLLKPK
jgi:hypothetical protein